MTTSNFSAGRDVAIVGFAQTKHVRSEDTLSEVELIQPVIAEAMAQVGLDHHGFDFYCSGSSDYLAGQAFSFVMTLDAIGAWPPVAESHVEMDGAWALYEAYLKIRSGHADTALVYGYGKSSPGDLPRVLSRMCEPYYTGPLWPSSVELAALVGLADGIVDLVVLRGYDDDRHQKNWMPAVDGDAEHSRRRVRDRSQHDSPDQAASEVERRRQVVQHSIANLLDVGPRVQCHDRRRGSPGVVVDLLDVDAVASAESAVALVHCRDCTTQPRQVDLAVEDPGEDAVVAEPTGVHDVAHQERLLHRGQRVCCADVVVDRSAGGAVDPRRQTADRGVLVERRQRDVDGELAAEARTSPTGSQRGAAGLEERRLRSRSHGEQGAEHVADDVLGGRQPGDARWCGERDHRLSGAAVEQGAAVKLPAGGEREAVDFDDLGRDEMCGQLSTQTGKHRVEVVPRCALAEGDQLRAAVGGLTGHHLAAGDLVAQLDDERLDPGDEGGLDLGQTPALEMGDPIVRRRDGVIAYHLAVVVDDADAGVTRVVRGRDLATSTATQVALQRLLGLPTPRYRHHLLLLEPRPAAAAPVDPLAPAPKLAKLHGSIPFDPLSARHDARALVGLLAHGIGLRPTAAPCSPAELLLDFDWARGSRRDVVARWADGLVLEPTDGMP